MSQDLSPLAKPQEPELLHELRALIHAVRSRVATAVNAELTLLHWRIGKRLLAENLHQGRAEYGQQILASLAQELAAEFGKGFSYSALTRMVRFAELFPDERIVVSLVQVLSWTHILALIPLKDTMAREFYAEMCRVERWSVRTLRQKIDSMLLPPTGQRCCPKLNSSRCCTKLCSGSAPGWLTEHHQTLRPSKTMAISARFIS